MLQTQTTTRLAKYSRAPDYTLVPRVARIGITPASLAIIQTIYRYRYIPTSLILKLVPGSRRNLYYHLQALFQKHQLINRMTLFRPGGYPEEFVYFLDSKRPLELLAAYGVMTPDELDFDQYAHGDLNEATEGHSLFVRHELMISRLHAMLELACAKSNNQVVLYDFKQGAELHSYVTIEGEEGERQTIPVRPDAFFTLYFPGRPEAQQYSSILYEADRATMDTTRMKQKLRGHFHFIVKQKRHQLRYDVPAIRAVLIETIRTDWAARLLEAAQDEIVSGPKPSNLFWFTSSESFTEPIIEKQEGKRARHIPYYQEYPNIIFKGLWHTPNDRVGDKPRSILDP